MSVLQMHGSMKNLENAWRRPIHNHLHEKADIYNAKSAIKVGVY